uniref:Uncharacterized protein n=1 Tax=Caenorhabditis japonica TaxID=281687 RepID=A0A8R1HZ61_CAEJA
MTSTRPKRITRHVTPAPIIEDDATIVRTCLDRLIYTVDVIARFDRTHDDIVAVNSGESSKTMAQVMSEVRWHEHASKARKDCPLGSTKKKRHYEEEEDEEEEEENPDEPSTSVKPPKTPKPTPDKKSTPSKAKLAALKKKADAARRKAQREAEKLAKKEEKEEVEDEDPEESYSGMPVLENATITEPTTPDDIDGVEEVQEKSPEITEEIVEPDSTVLDENNIEKFPEFEKAAPLENGTVTANMEAPASSSSSTSPSSPSPSTEEKFETIAVESSEQNAPIEQDEQEEQKIIDVPKQVLNGLCEIEEKKEEEEDNYDHELYPLDFVPCEKDVPGRVWCPPRLTCQATNEPVVAIGPLTELETLDLTLCSESLDFLLPAKGELILTRMLELQIPFLEMKLLNPEMSEEDRELNIKQLEIYEKQLDECHDKAALQRVRIANLPGADAPVIPLESECIVKFTEFDPTWYSSSRKWCFDKGENSEIEKFKLPLVHDMTDRSPIIQKRMLEFRETLSKIFEYKDFEQTYMQDPVFRELFKILEPLPYENGAVLEEAEDELMALISKHKIKFAAENPVLPMPATEDVGNEKDVEVEAATVRFLADVVDTVVFRELTDLPTYPHRIPIYKPGTAQPELATENELHPSTATESHVETQMEH